MHFRSNTQANTNIMLMCNILQLLSLYGHLNNFPDIYMLGLFKKSFNLSFKGKL